MPDEELERFEKINLSEFAASRGYALDRRESSRNSAVMRHPNGDKIIIARNEASGDWMYFSARDDRDNGTIIDFVQHLDGVSLGRVRQILRSWLGSPHQLCMFVKDLEPVSRDRAAVVAVWERSKNCFSLPYLTNRGLGPDVLLHPRFSGRVRVYHLKDEDGEVLFYNNVAFPTMTRAGCAGLRSKTRDLPALLRAASRACGLATPCRPTGNLSLWKAALTP